MTIPLALEFAAGHFGERRAYVEGPRTVTWRELAEAARSTARSLTGMGLRRGDRVAICGENSIDWIVAYHAAAMCGAAAALVYFELQPREIQNQVRRPECRFLFASASVLQKISLPECVEQVVVIGEPGGAPGVALEEVTARGAGSEAMLEGPWPDDMAAIIYTSGTTGGAKGVMLSHRNLLSNAHAVMETLDVSSKDSVLLVLPLHHAMPFIATVLLPGFVGAYFVIENDLRRIRDRLQEHRPTIFFGVPALYELVYRNILARAASEGRLGLFLKMQRLVRLVKRVTGMNIGHIVFKQVHRALGGRLRFLVSGGAALSPKTALDYFSLGLPLLQGWGMSEASPAVAVQRFSPRRFRYTRYYERHAGSVGQPLPGVEVRLIDVPDKGISAAESGEGELIVRGDNVFMGYWQAEEETAAVKRDGWLHTGDLGRIDKDGNIYLTGRSKYVIVLDSGEKVIPDELEETLAQSEVIGDICVVGRRVRDKTQVTAVIYPDPVAVQARVSGDHATLDEESLARLVGEDIERLGKQLAAYKRVTRIELSDEPLPKTALRKVARGHISDVYEFDFERWKASAAEADL